jgi:hypothetical protein
LQLDVGTVLAEKSVAASTPGYWSAFSRMETFKISPITSYPAELSVTDKAAKYSKQHTVFQKQTASFFRWFLLPSSGGFCFLLQVVSPEEGSSLVPKRGVLFLVFL